MILSSTPAAALSRDFFSDCGVSLALDAVPSNFFDTIFSLSPAAVLSGVFLSDCHVSSTSLVSTLVVIPLYTEIHFNASTYTLPFPDYISRGVLPNPFMIIYYGGVYLTLLQILVYRGVYLTLFHLQIMGDMKVLHILSSSLFLIYKIHHEIHKLEPN